MYYQDRNNESNSPYHEDEPYQPAVTATSINPVTPPPGPARPATDDPGMYRPAAASDYQAPTLPGPVHPVTDDPGTYEPVAAPPDPTRRPSRGLRTGAIIALTLVLALVFGTGLFAGWQFGRTSAPVADSNLQTGNSQTPIPQLTGNANIETVREAVIDRVRPTVVQVNVQTSQGDGLGSGVIIDKRGYIITNNHVVEGARQLSVKMANGTVLPGQVVGTDPADDLAVIKINPPANMPVATLGDSSELRVGQEVLAIGNPLGITQTVTRGIISALNRQVPGDTGTLPDAIQTDAPINPGNSGGALVDLQGNVIGVPTAAAIDPEFRTPANGVGFAIPANRVKFIAQQIISSGKVTHTGRAALGVSVFSVDQAVAAQRSLAIDRGVFLDSVVNGGPADKAGLQAGDVVVQMDNAQINDTSSLSSFLISKNVGDKVAVKVYRGNQQLTVNVTLGELQAG